MEDLSNYIFQDNEYWLTAAQAARRISEQSGREIKPDYLHQLVLHGRLIPRKLGPRLNLYPLSQVSRIVVSHKPGPKGPHLNIPSGGMDEA